MSAFRRAMLWPYLPFALAVGDCVAWSLFGFALWNTLP